ncbi:MAG: hypothetical protein AB1544_11445 [Pseudomonadota bacterium]|jgi:uncharacterized protein YukE
MNAKQKIEAIAKEKAGHEQALETLRVALDAAADAGNLAEVKRVQTDTAAVQELVASCDRRVEKLQADLIAEQKAAQRKANDAALAEFKAAYKHLPPRAHKIGQIIASLAAELEAFHADAREAAASAFPLVKQINAARAHDYLHLCGYVSFTDDVLGHCVSDELRKAGIFGELATNNHVDLPRLDLPPIGEVIEKRVESLTQRVETVHDKVNEYLA